MDIYIEYVIIDNFVIDFCIILLMLKTLGLRVSKIRIILSSAIGTVLAIVLPLFKIYDIIAFFVKLILSVAMIFTASSYKSKKQCFYAFLLFYTYTFVMGGACFGLLYLYCGDVTLGAFLNYSSAVPIGLVVFVILGYVYFINLIIRFFKKRRDIINFLYDVQIYYKDNNIKVIGFLDSGNRLYFNETNAPVIVINLKTALRLINSDEVDFFIKLNKNFKYINFSTIEGVNKKMPVIISDKVDIFINGKCKSFDNVALCISFKDFNDAEKYEALLHPALITTQGG